MPMGIHAPTGKIREDSNNQNVPPLPDIPAPIQIAMGLAALTMLGWLVGNHFAIKREIVRDAEAKKYSAKQAMDGRKRDLLGFLGKWRSETERFDPKSTAKIWDKYTQNAALLSERMAQMHEDLVGASECQELGAKLVGLRHADVIGQKDDPRDIIKAAIDALARSLKELRSDHKGLIT